MSIKTYFATKKWIRRLQSLNLVKLEKQLNEEIWKSYNKWLDDDWIQYCRSVEADPDNKIKSELNHLYIKQQVYKEYFDKLSNRISKQTNLDIFYNPLLDDLEDIMEDFIAQLKRP